MELKISGKTYDKFSDFKLSLTYDSVASAFSFSAYFNPENPDHVQIFRPCTYRSCSVEHNGERLITGRILSNRFISSPVPTLSSISGYSTAGVLGDCEIPVELYPLQNDGLTLKEICERLIEPFGIELVVDSSVETIANEKIDTSTANEKQTVKSYLAELAAQRGVILSHSPFGNLLLTKANTDRRAIADIDGSAPTTSIELSVNGQSMHNTITAMGQSSTETTNSSEDSVNNPFVSAYRPKVVTQTSGTDNTAMDVARIQLSNELKSIAVKVTVSTWEFGGQLIRPNNMIIITAPEAYIFKKTRFFISQVDLSGTVAAQTAVLTCVLPSVFDQSDPFNIFN
jgi:prophage tail gpP-like protein